MKRRAIAAAIVAVPVFAVAQFIRATVSGPVSMAGLTEVVDRARVVRDYGMTVKQLRAMPVHAIDGDAIGEVVNVLRTDDDEVVAVTVALGGVLGIGAHHVVVRLDQLHPDRDGLLLDMTEDQAHTLPTWDA